MSILRKDPVYEINKYLWNELVDSEILELTDYQIGGIQYRPIFPVQEPPALQSGTAIEPFTDFHGEPWIVYDVALPEYGSVSFWECQEQILYTIKARDYMDTREVQMGIYDIFHRLDQSATDLNRYLGPSSAFRYHWVNVIDSPPPDPKDSPDDPAQSFIMVEYQYSRWIRNDGRFAS